MESAEDFKKVYEKSKVDILSTIDKARQAQQQANREKLTPIADAIILCGRKGLKGYRDVGPLSMNQAEENDCNFRALLRFAIQNGSVLQKNPKPPKLAFWIRACLGVKIGCRSQIEKCCRMSNYGQGRAENFRARGEI